MSLRIDIKNIVHKYKPRKINCVATNIMQMQTNTTYLLTQTIAISTIFLAQVGGIILLSPRGKHHVVSIFDAECSKFVRDFKVFFSMQSKKLFFAIAVLSSQSTIFIYVTSENKIEFFVYS